MAMRYFAVSATGTVSESANARSTLTTEVQTKVDAAATANAAAGAKADVTAELAAVTDAVRALSAEAPTGGVVVMIDTSTVTTLNKLRQLLDAAYAHAASSNLIS